jgi:hypothetical protein
VVSFTPRPLYPQVKSPCHTLYRRLGGPQSWSGRGSEEKNSQLLTGFKPPIIQPVVYVIIRNQPLDEWFHVEWLFQAVKASLFLWNARNHDRIVRTSPMDSVYSHLNQVNIFTSRCPRFTVIISFRLRLDTSKCSLCTCYYNQNFISVTHFQHA